VFFIFDGFLVFLRSCSSFRLILSNSDQEPNPYKKGSCIDINLVGQLLELTVTAYTKMPQITSAGGRLQSTCVSSAQASFSIRLLVLQFVRSHDKSITW
jgi:hypothetical protein